MVQPIETILGPMNSGKSTELIRRLKRESIAGAHIVVIKPKIDNRSQQKIESRDGLDLPAHEASSSEELLLTVIDEIHQHPRKRIVVGIDEAQFFDSNLPDTLRFIARELDTNVVVSGLLRDFRGEPFGPMPLILAYSQNITTLTAICTHIDPVTNEICGSDATETYRSVNNAPADWNDSIVLTGDVQEGYGSRCPEHHLVTNRPPSIDNPAISSLKKDA